MSPSQIEKLLLDAADIGGWFLIRRRYCGRSVYFDFSHTSRPNVTVRLSDHPARKREHQKLLCVHRARENSVWPVMRFLKDRGKPLYVRRFRPRR